MRAARRLLTLPYLALRAACHVVLYSWRCSVYRFLEAHPMLREVLFLPSCWAGSSWRALPYGLRRAVILAVGAAKTPAFRQPLAA